MTYVSKIIDTFGGTRPMARALGKSPSTVQSWKDRGSIPDDEKPVVLAKAVSLGLTLGPADFFPQTGDAA
jgi:hypothetical protein